MSITVLTHVNKDAKPHHPLRQNKAANRGRLLSRLAYTVREAALATTICVDGLYKAIREGALVPRNFGNRTLIPHKELERWIESLPALDLKTQPNKRGRKRKQTAS